MDMGMKKQKTGFVSMIRGWKTELVHEYLGKTNNVLRIIRTEVAEKMNYRNGRNGTAKERKL